MLRSRVIPCLLVRQGGLVKTRQFTNPKYVGDPLNAVRIFNEKAADEIVVIDIDASTLGREPDYRMIESLATQCRMPLCYGGGVSSVDQCARIISFGVEKVALSSAAISDRSLVESAARILGCQSIVVILDVKRTGLFRQYRVFTHNGTRNTGHDPVDLARLMESCGAGEIIINSIDRDGTREGYDTELFGRIRDATALPLTILGGASGIDEMRDVANRYGPVGLAAGSLFVFKGTYQAVLISYPSMQERDTMVAAMK